MFVAVIMAVVMAASLLVPLTMARYIGRNR